MRIPITQLENSMESLRSRKNQIEDRISGLEDKVWDMDKIRKNMKKEKNKGKRHTENIGHHEKIKPSNCRHRRGRTIPN